MAEQQLFQIDDLALCSELVNHNITESFAS